MGKCPAHRIQNRKKVPDKVLVGGPDQTLKLARRPFLVIVKLSSQPQPAVFVTLGLLEGLRQYIAFYGLLSDIGSLILDLFGNIDLVFWSFNMSPSVPVLGQIGPFSSHPEAVYPFS